MEFAEELKEFQKKTSAWPERYDGLILVGTGQATTGALLIGRFTPTWVVYLLTEPMQNYPQDVAAALHFAPVVRDSIPLADDSPLAIYAALKSLWQHYPDIVGQRMAVDVTGGKKPMGIGLAKAAYVLGITTIYVDSKYQEGGIVPGSQRLIAMPEPYQLFGDIQAAEATRLWATHDYSGATRIYTQLAALDALESGEQAYYTSLAQVATAYSAWDSFALTEAATTLTKVVENPLPSLLLSVAETLRQQAHALEELKEVTAMDQARMNIKQASTNAEKQQAEHVKNTQQLSVLQNLTVMGSLLGSLYANGQRRAAQGRYDLAALMLYRCLELIMQQRLASHDILSEDARYKTDWKQVPNLQLHYNRICAQQDQRRQPWNAPKQMYDLPSRHITLFSGYILLAALDDPLLTDYEIGRIEERTEARNTSILAHGYRLITQEEYKRFSEVVEELLERFLRLTGIKRVTWERTYQFVYPFAAGH